MDVLVIPTLETQRLRLRSFCRDDLDDYAALTSDREVLRYLGWGPEPWDRGRSWRNLAFLLGHWQLRGAGTWAVEHRQTGAFLGMVGFSEPAGWPGCELAWTLARRFWGQGYATEAARAALDYAFTRLAEERLISLIHPDNRASIRVAERLGESLAGCHEMNGRELLVYGITRESYDRLAIPPERRPRISIAPGKRPEARAEEAGGDAEELRSANVTSRALAAPCCR